MTIDEKQIKKLAQEKIKQGLTKQIIYTELNQEFNGGQKLANIIQSLPSYQALKRYNFLHILFLVLLCVMILLLLLSQSYGGIIWTAPIIYFAATHKARLYGWACIGGLYGLLSGTLLIIEATKLLNMGSIILMNSIAIIILIISAFIIFSGFFLRAKLTPSYIEKKELYENSEGNNRLRLVFEFKD